MKKLIAILLTLLSFGAMAQHGNFTDIRLLNGSAGLAGTTNGTIYFDTGTGLFQFRQGGAWLPLGTGTGDMILSSVQTSTGKKTFQPDATNPGFNFGSYAGNPSGSVNGDAWYNSTANVLKARINGSIVSLIFGAVGSGQVPYGTSGDAVSSEAAFTYNASTDVLSVPNLITTTDIYITNKTSGRVPIFSTSGLIVEDSDLTFSGSTTSATNLTVATNLTNTALTAGRLIYSGTGGLLSTEGALAYDATLNAITLANVATTATATIFGGEIQLDDVSASDDLTINNAGISSTGNAAMAITNASGAVTITSSSSGDINLTASDDIISTTTSFNTTLGNNALVYGADYSASYNNRSLIDLEYLSTILSSTKTKLVDIGDWDMDGTTNVLVNHGLADHTQIRSINVMIRNDDGSVYQDLRSSVVATGVVAGSNTTNSSTQIRLVRTDLGIFDGTDYNATSYNRGYIIIVYVDSF